MFKKNFLKCCLFLFLFIFPTLLFADAGGDFSFGIPMAEYRMGHHSFVLSNGKLVLLGGHGTGFTSLNSVEIMTPGFFGNFSYYMNYTHDGPVFAKLLDGRYLIAGGSSDWGVPAYANAEIYDPADNSFTITGSMVRFRASAGAATLTSGKVLVAGAWYNHNDAYNYGELYNPLSGTFSETGPVITPRAANFVLPTNDNKAVVFGGYPYLGGAQIEQVEMYDADSNSFSLYQNTLFNGETGWSANLNYNSQVSDLDAYKLNNGKYLFLAFKSTGEQTLGSFDPITKQFAKIDTIPLLPINTNVSLFPPQINKTNNKVYLLGILAGTDPVQLKLYTVDLDSGILYTPTDSYTLPSACYPSIAGISILNDGRIVLTGGYSQSGYNTNFSPINNMLYITPSAPSNNQSMFNKNLILNGDAELGVGSNDGFSIVSVPNWTLSGNFNAVQYAVGGGFPDINSPGPLLRGNNFFAGGPSSGISSASQIIDVSSIANGIDANRVTFDFSGYLGGYASQSDNAIVTVNFKNVSDVIIGNAELGPTTAAERGDATGLLFKSANPLNPHVPIGTRKIEIVILMTRNEGDYNDGYVDNLSLVLSAAQVQTHTITASAGTGGTITPSGSVIVTDGLDQTFAIQSDADHFISDVLVDSVSVGPVTSYKFTNVITNHTINVIFGTGVNETNGDWALTNVVLNNTQEAELMARVGDIDNLNFGWPTGFDPFSGESTPVHGFPWTINTNDPAGTDKIMVITSYNGNPPNGNDGYTGSTSRPDNNIQNIALNYNAQNITVTSAVLQLFVDDFQAGVWGADYQVLLNGKRAFFLENSINALNQTGPIGKLISAQVPQEFLADIASGALTINIDDNTTGAGDGYAIDFVKLLINPKVFLKKGTIIGTVTDKDTGLPIQNATVSASGIIETQTDNLGAYTLSNVPAGQVVVTAKQVGYDDEVTVSDLIANQSLAINFELSPQEFTITTTSGAGGTINPLGTTKAKYGSNQTINIIPNNNYRILNVLVDGVSVGALGTYQFNNIISDHTIEATFELTVPKISVQPVNVDFGNVNLNNTETRTITVSNTGNADLVISSIELSGQNANEFNKQYTGTIVSSGSSLTITVNLIPTSAGQKIAKIIITTNDSDSQVVEINLTGNGIATGSTSSGGKKGCIITKISTKNNESLKKIRDELMLSNKLGKAIVDFYYNLSPKIVEFFKGN